MPKAIPNPQGPRTNGSHRPEVPRSRSERDTPTDLSLDFGQAPAAFDAWGNQGAAAPGGGQGTSGLADLTQPPLPPRAGTSPEEVERLLAENGQLRAIVAELQDLVEESTRQNDQGWADRQKEYDGLLEEKSELIRTLHLRIQELEAQKPAAPPTPKEE
jgi:hypothetical protein